MNKEQTDRQTDKIPKVIHYCWFGKNEKPKLFYRCLESWKRCCPDYEIVEWNEDNFDIDIIPYVKEAYEAKKWAFVTDYARLWIVYNYGGIYLDTDVELLKSLDVLLSNEAFFGIEDNNYINTGIGFGAKKGNNVVYKMMLDYSEEHFLNNDGTFNKTTCPIRNTRAISELLPMKFDEEIVQIENAALYPAEYFCPLSPDGKQMTKTNNTFSVHWFSASWLDSEEAVIHEWRVFKGKCENRYGRNFGSIVARLIYLFLPQKRKILKKHSKE